MENEAFVEEMKVGVGVLVLGLMRNLFIRVIRRITILMKNAKKRLGKATPHKSVSVEEGDNGRLKHADRFFSELKSKAFRELNASRVRELTALPS